MPESENLSAVSPSPWRPLRIPLFRNLLIADFVSDVGSFMQAVGAAWLMTSLSSSPLQIALIQAASALPFFLLALPAGSIGDIVDRRKLILGTEFWMLTIAIILVIATFAHLISPWLLLADHSLGVWPAKTALLCAARSTSNCPAEMLRPSGMQSQRSAIQVQHALVIFTRFWYHLNR
jgi:MFS family permease